MSQPLYRQIADRIREDTALHPPGYRLPAENELAVQLKVSRPTIRQALDLLTREGRVVRVKGSGTFTAQPKLLHESTTFVTGYREESRNRHRTLHTKVICLELQHADERTADALRLPARGEITRLTRIRWLEGLYGNAPVVYTTVCVPVRLFPDMAKQNFTDTSFYDALAERGLSVVRASRQLEVTMPPPEVAAGLEISAFEPTAYIVSRGETREGLPVEYSESWYPASRSSFRIEVSR